MKSILETITESKRREVERQKKRKSAEELTAGFNFQRECISLKDHLMKEGASGIISEFKRKSPSKGAIHAGARVDKVTRGYAAAGASGLSVLTDHDFFGGTLSDLATARKVNPEMPILRKDFIIDPYQLTEAKAYGADVVLLIAACLTRQEIEDFAGKTKELGMEVLLEIHGEMELEKISPMADLIGVNNRNLKTFAVNPETSLRLADFIPARYTRISESGLSSPETIRQLRRAGYSGFLIGETFMKTTDPARACQAFIEETGSR